MYTYIEHTHRWELQLRLWSAWKQIGDICDYLKDSVIAKESGKNVRPGRNCEMKKCDQTIFSKIFLNKTEHINYILKAIKIRILKRMQGSKFGKELNKQCLLDIT